MFAGFWRLFFSGYAFFVFRHPFQGIVQRSRVVSYRQSRILNGQLSYRIASGSAFLLDLNVSLSACLSTGATFYVVLAWPLTTLGLTHSCFWFLSAITRKSQPAKFLVGNEHVIVPVRLTMRPCACRTWTWRPGWVWGRMPHATYLRRYTTRPSRGRGAARTWRAGRSTSPSNTS